VQRRSQFSDVFLSVTDVLLVIGWLLVIGGAAFLVIELYPVVMNLIRMVQEGYSIVHGELIPPR